MKEVEVIGHWHISPPLHPIGCRDAEFLLRDFDELIANLVEFPTLPHAPEVTVASDHQQCSFAGSLELGAQLPELCIKVVGWLDASILSICPINVGDATGQMRKATFCGPSGCPDIPFSSDRNFPG